jgi:hypothetical protein
MHMWTIWGIQPVAMSMLGVIKTRCSLLWLTPRARYSDFKCFCVAVSHELFNLLHRAYTPVLYFQDDSDWEVRSIYMISTKGWKKRNENLCCWSANNLRLPHLSVVIGCLPVQLVLLLASALYVRCSFFCSEDGALNVVTTCKMFFSSLRSLLLLYKTIIWWTPNYKALPVGPLHLTTTKAKRFESEYLQPLSYMQ